MGRVDFLLGRAGAQQVRGLLESVVSLSDGKINTDTQWRTFEKVAVVMSSWIRRVTIQALVVLRLGSAGIASITAARASARVPCPAK